VKKRRASKGGSQVVEEGEAGEGTPANGRWNFLKMSDRALMHVRGLRVAAFYGSSP
jgi:hypothetical protein